MGNGPDLKKENGETIINPTIQDIHFDAIMEKETFDLSHYFSAVFSICSLAMIDLAVNNKNINDYNLESYICCEIKYKDAIEKTFSKHVVVTLSPAVIIFKDRKVRIEITYKSVSKKAIDGIYKNKNYREI